jgi:MFS family permease
LAPSDIKRPSTKIIEDIDLKNEYPEGGLRAWLVVFGSWCALFASLGIMNTLGTFQAFLTTHQLSNYNESTIGWIFSVHTFMAWFGGIFIGPLFDKYGPKTLVLLGSVCVVVSMILLGLCRGEKSEKYHKSSMANIF